MPQVFVKKAAKQEVGFSVGAILRRKAVKGDIGLEIEMEGKNLLHVEDTPSPWVYHKDGSLRGEENAEYVLDKPVVFDKVEPALNTLFKALEKKKAVIDESNRTSVHVHLNVQSFAFNRLTSFMGLYFIFEELLSEWCGEHRVGNLFCMRAKDTPAIITQIKKFIKSDGSEPLYDHLHYAAMNANALNKFGSLEFRTMRGVSSAEPILQWVGILRRLYELSEEFPDPRDVCADFSGLGPTSFFEKLLGSHAMVIRQGISFDEDRIRQSLYEGIRYAQDLCYCRDWSVFLPIEIKADPFGRSESRVMASMTAFMSSPATPDYDEDDDDEYIVDIEAFPASPTFPPPSPAIALNNTTMTWATTPDNPFGD